MDLWSGIDWSSAPVWLVALTIVIRLGVYPLLVLQRDREKTASQTVMGYQQAEARDSALVNRLIDAIEKIASSERAVVDIQRDTNATLKTISDGITNILQNQQDSRIVLNRVDETTRDTNTLFKALDANSQLSVVRREIAVGKAQNAQTYKLVVQIGRALRKKGVI